MFSVDYHFNLVKSSDLVWFQDLQILVCVLCVNIGGLSIGSFIMCFFYFYDKNISNHFCQKDLDGLFFKYDHLYFNISQSSLMRLMMVMLLLFQVRVNLIWLYKLKVYICIRCMVFTWFCPPHYNSLKGCIKIIVFVMGLLMKSYCYFVVFLIMSMLNDQSRVMNVWRSAWSDISLFSVFLHELKTENSKVHFGPVANIWTCSLPSNMSSNFWTSINFLHTFLSWISKQLAARKELAMLICSMYLTNNNVPGFFGLIMDYTSH